MSVKEVLADNFAQSYRVVAEISEMHESRGHAYIELIEKQDDTVKAKARATIWANTYRIISSYFRTVTGHNLEAGIKVLVVVTVEFHEIYGFSLNIRDIDPTYTLGDIERQRLQIIKMLEDEGVVDMNKEIEMPDVPQKIAIISSETAAGYGDFVNQLHDNEFGYKFYLKLFPAIVQGNAAEESIISALDNIYNYNDFFDVVVIIRGGGSKADLSCFDSYDIAQNIAQFPLPVITGIGHERDESISDLVANTSLKTPTAVAEFLISKLQYAETELETLKDNFVYLAKDLLYNTKTKLNTTVYNLKPVIIETISRRNNELSLISQKIISESKSCVSNQMRTLNNLPEKVNYLCKSKLNNENRNVNLKKIALITGVERLMLKKNHEINISEQKNSYLSPKNILKRGYSYTVHNGKLVKTTRSLKKGDIIETKLYIGKVKSKIL